MPPTQSNGAPPPYTPTPTPYPTAMYPIRSAYPQQNIYAQVRILNKSWQLYLEDTLCTLLLNNVDEICRVVLVRLTVPFNLFTLVNMLTLSGWLHFTAYEYNLKQFYKCDNKWCVIFAIVMNFRTLFFFASGQDFLSAEIVWHDISSLLSACLQGFSFDPNLVLVQCVDEMTEKRISSLGISCSFAFCLNTIIVIV